MKYTQIDIIVLTACHMAVFGGVMFFSNSTALALTAAASLLAVIYASLMIGDAIVKAIRDKE